jgi:trigger factor
MNVVKEDAVNLTSVIKIQLEKDDYQPKVEKSLKEYAKKVKMDGFRPGKVPFGMVKKMYGQYILIEEVNKLVSDSLSNYIAENKLNLLGDPLPSDEQKTIDWDNDESVEFTFDVAIAPEVDLKLSKKNKADYYKIAVTDEMAKDQLDGMAARYGEQINVDVIEGTEIVRADLVQVDEKGNVVEDGHVKQNASMLLSSVKNEAEADLFKGKKKGDVFVFNPKKVFDADVEVASLLGVTKDDTDKMLASYQITINELIRNKKAEMNQEFFDNAFGKDTVTSEQEAIAKIKSDTEQRLMLNSDYKFFIDQKTKLVESTEISLPEEFLKRWLLVVNKEKGITEEQIEKEFPLFVEDLKWQLIKNSILKDNEITVTEEELVKASKDFTRMQFAQFGMFNPSEEDLDKWGREFLKNREEAQRLYDSELDKKVIAYIKDAVKLNEQEVSLEEFGKLMEK